MAKDEQTREKVFVVVTVTKSEIRRICNFPENKKITDEQMKKIALNLRCAIKEWHGDDWDSDVRIVATEILSPTTP